MIGQAGRIYCCHGNYFRSSGLYECKSSMKYKAHRQVRCVVLRLEINDNVSTFRRPDWDRELDSSYEEG